MFSYYWSSLLCLLWQNENTWICDPSISALFLHCILFAHNSGFLNKAESIHNPVYFMFAGVCNCWLTTCVMLYHLQAWGSCYWGDYFHCLDRKSLNREFLHVEKNLVGMDRRRASSTCTSIRSWDYEVFLSFKGEDTRYNFTDHLYAALYQKGIRTFRLDEIRDSYL